MLVVLLWGGKIKKNAHTRLTITNNSTVSIFTTIHSVQRIHSIYLTVVLFFLRCQKCDFKTLPLLFHDSSQHNALTLTYFILFSRTHIFYYSTTQCLKSVIYLYIQKKRRRKKKLVVFSVLIILKRKKRTTIKTNNSTT